MSIAYIRKTYGVDFKVGQQVRIRRGKELFMGGQIGKLLRARGQYLVVKGEHWEGQFHPGDVEALAKAQHVTTQPKGEA